MKRTYSKFAAQPEHDRRHRPRPSRPATTAERVRASLLLKPPRP
jgi:hypothetical protein